MRLNLLGYNAKTSVKEPKRRETTLSCRSTDGVVNDTRRFINNTSCVGLLIRVVA